MTFDAFIKKIMLTPYVDKGRDYDGIDCYGMLYLAYKDVLGVALPTYVDEYDDTGKTAASREALSALITGHTHEWEPVDGRYRPMDVALFTLGGQPIHIGVMIGKDKFIHCEEKIGVIVERLSSAKWAKRKEGVYRLCQKKSE